MVVISEKSIERLIEEIAPRVERLTSWNTYLDTLAIKLVKRDQVYEQGIKPKYEFLGIDTETKTERGRRTLKFTKRILPYIILGLYEPYTNTLLIVPDNVRTGTNESGLAVTLGHELVHRCQFTNNSRFADLYSVAVKKVTGSLAFEEDEQEDKSYKKYLQALMTLTEGDASFVEDQLKKMFYQDAKRKTAGLSNAVGLILLFASLGTKESSFIQKLKQYRLGKKIVKEVYEAEGREAVNGLYDLDARGLYRKFR